MDGLRVLIVGLLLGGDVSPPPVQPTSPPAPAAKPASGVEAAPTLNPPPSPSSAPVAPAPQAVAAPPVNAAPASPPPAVGQGAQVAVETMQSAGIVLHRPAVIHDGQMLVVEMRSPNCSDALKVVWQGGTFKAYPVQDGWNQALLPVSLKVKFGTQKLQIQCGGQHASFDLPVTPGTFPESHLTVDPKFTSISPPPRAAQEQAQITQAFAKSEGKRLWSEAFVKPATGVETSPFGVRRTYNGQLKSRHMGQDFDGKIGEALWAANDGVVALAAPDFFFVGNAVFIDHGDRLFTMYFHMSQLHVKTGDRVTRGQLLGNIGNTGRVTGPHVHFAVKLGGTYVNPEDLLSYDPKALLEAVSSVSTAR